MKADSLRKEFNVISVEEMVTVNGEDKILICEFCHQPVRYEIAMEVKGQITYAWLCGECPKSKAIMSAPTGGGRMLKNYLKAGYPALCVLTQEPHRAEQVLPCEGWKFYIWDCLRGIKEAGTTRIMEEIRDPVEAVNWLGQFQDTILMAHNLHLFLEVPEVIQAIQNGIPRWKATGSALVMISPVIQMRAGSGDLFPYPGPGASQRRRTVYPPD
jgi:hypothetical protein